MRLVTRSRLATLLVASAILGGFGLALVRGDNVDPGIPSKEEWLFHAEIEEHPYPRTVSSFVDRRFGRAAAPPGFVAVVTVESILTVNPEQRMPQSKSTPPPVGNPPTVDYELRIVMLLSSESPPPRETLTLRLVGTPPPHNQNRATFMPFAHPEVGQRLLVSVQRSTHPIYAGVYTAAGGSLVDISGPKAHFLDVWRTSVKEMGAPEATPAFIEAVRAALASPR